MSHSNLIWEQLRPYFQAFRTHYKLWTIPTVALTLAALAYVLVMPRVWRASQAILVRDEAIGNQHRQGQFDSIDRMKVFQETILEVARNRVVVETVLKKLGPPADYGRNKPWPTHSAITSLQHAIGVSAPRGAEFGRTEILLLSVTGRTPAEAIARTKVLCDELEKHLGDLRDAKARSIVGELEQTLRLAQIDLDEATARLEQIERDVGTDLGELRVLNELGSGDGNLRTGLNQIKTELRLAETNRESLQQLRDLLNSASQNPDKLLATPSRLLDAQPALKRLKEGLVDAQLRSASLRGRLSDVHPTVISALRTEEEIRRDLHAEVATALKGVEADLAANSAHIARLSQQQSDLQNSLDRLASLRARYSNLVSDVKRRSEIVDHVKKDLAAARASIGAATVSSLLTRFHEPTTGDRPVGPGRTSIVGGSMAGGLAIGAGLVFLFMPIGPNGTGRRWNDYLNLGRRATDRLFGRRADDRTDTRASMSTVWGQTAGRLVGRRGGDPPPPSPPVVGGRRETDIPALPAAAPTKTSELDRRQGTGRRSADQD